VITGEVSRSGRHERSSVIIDEFGSHGRLGEFGIQIVEFENTVGLTVKVVGQAQKWSNVVNGAFYSSYR